MDVRRLGVELELWLPAYTTAAATKDLSCICNLQLMAVDPDLLSEARDQTHILMDTSKVHFLCATRETPICTYCVPLI